LGGRPPPSIPSSPRASESCSFYFLRKWTRQNTWSSLKRHISRLSSLMDISICWPMPPLTRW
jgi:hypothetical protein